MQFADQISMVNHLTTTDEVAAYFKALYQDGIIWEETQRFLADPSSVESLITRQRNLDAGSLCLFSIDPGIDFSRYPRNSFSGPVLEHILFEYEDYIQSDEPVVQFSRAAILAAALIEKRKVTSQWKNVILEITSRMKISTAEKFEQFWKTVFAITINLADDREELLSDLLNLQQPELGLGIFTHSVLCLPVDDAQKCALFSSHLQSASAQIQSAALRLIQESSDPEVVRSVAQRLFEKYSRLDVSEQSYENHWSNPASSLQFALQCQSAADVAAFAGETQSASDMTKKSLEILAAVASISKIKLSAYLPDSKLEGFQKTHNEDDITRPEVAAELVYSKMSDKVDIGTDQAVYPIKVVQLSREMKAAGNDDLAGSELTAVLSQLSDSDLEELLLKGPRFVASWNAAEVLDTLVNSNSTQEASRFAEILLHKNPSDKRINLAAAKAFESVGNDASALRNWQALALVDPCSNEIKRNLGKAYLKNGNKSDAFVVLNSLVSGDAIPQESDLLEFADIALDLDRFDEVLMAAGTVLDENPENAPALTLKGLAYYRKGETEQANECLQKAIDVPGEDPRAWIVLSEIHGMTGNRDAALNVLKEGLAASPDQRTLKTAYASCLVQNGSIAEAYPLLRDLSSSGSDHDTDAMLIDVMKQLGAEDICIVLEEMMKRYPEDAGVQADYGQYLVNNGKLSDGFNVLKAIKNKVGTNPEWIAAYLQGLLGTDYAILQSDNHISVKEINEAIGMVDSIISNHPDHVKAKMLKGELLTKNNQYQASFNLYSEILENKNLLDNSWLVRLHADLARSASASNKPEIALASIEEAVNLQPDWIGLQQLKTEILIASGDVLKAEAQFKQTLEIQPDSTAKSIWAAETWKRLGNTCNAAAVVEEAIARDSDQLGLRILAAEIKLDQEPEMLDPEAQESMKSLIIESNDARDLIRSAAVFARLKQPDDVITALTRAAELGSTEAWVNLAGFHRSNNDLSGATGALNQVDGMDNVLSIFKAEIEFSNGNSDSALALLADAANDRIEIEFEPVFLPAEWQVIVETSQPATAMWLTISLKSGNHQGAVDKAREWIAADPQNLEARIYGIETALACNSSETYNDFLETSNVNASDKLARYYQLLRIERDQDNGIYALSAEESAGENPVGMLDDPAVITHVRAIAAEGRILEAETLLEQIVSDISQVSSVQYVRKLGLVRNAVKAAISTNRWKEAVGLYRQFGCEMNNNEAMKSLFLKSLVSSIEFFNSVQGLSVQTHLPWTALFVATLEDDINRLSDSANEEQNAEIQRWVLRANLALNPSNENIRALALITPQADDAAAMMAGLRATDQESTAIQVAKKFNNDSRVMFELAACLVEKAPEKAIEILNTTLGISPDQPVALCLLSRILENLGRRQEALERLEEAIGLWPNEAQWHVKAAEILNTLGNLDEPVRHLQAALELDPSDTEIIYQLGKAQALTGNQDEAMGYLQEAASKSPNRAEIWEAISDAHQLAGDLDLALDAADKASKADPFAVRPHLQAGRVNWNKGEIEKALDQVRLAISLNPEDADSYVFLARLLQEKGEQGKALETLEKASRCKSINVRTMIDHAALLKEINGTAAARDLLSAFSLRFPENPELLKMLAEAEEECGDLKKAEIAAKRALELHPEESDLHLLLGGLQEKTGNLDQAAHYFSQAIAHDPNDKVGYVKLSQAFIKQREFAKAREVLEEGIRRAPQDVDLYLAAANLLKDAKDYRGAEQMLRKASAIDPRNLIVHRQLGAVLALNLVHQSQEVSSQL